MSNYTKIHIHSDLSNGTTNIDSVTKFNEYIDTAKELGMKAIAFTEHGNVFEWVKKKETCDKAEIKYIHGCEVYITKSLNEKARDNMHTCIYAKNFEGVKEINKLVSNSNNREDGHFYYVPRISMEEFLNLSDNIIVSSACLGGVLAKGDIETKQEYIRYFIKNKERCFLEIQHHYDINQIKHNMKMYEISKKYGLKLIAGTDTHALNDRHLYGRKMLQKSKKILFGEEDGWDLGFKSYNELIKAYEKQCALPIEAVKEAIENTNILSDMVEEFELDRSHKYPKLFDDSEGVFKKKIKEGIKKRGINKLPNFKSEYIPRVNHEFNTYKNNGAIDFMLLEDDVASFCKENNIEVGYSRGSVSGSVVAYILDITEMDSIKHKLNFERFMNSERISLGDIDVDYCPCDREAVKEYLFNKKGLYCSDIITFNTIALKGAIRDIGRALEMPLEEVDYISKHIEDDGKEEEFRNKYTQLFELVDIVKGTIVSVGFHPCGTVVSPYPIDELMGTFTTKTNKYPITQINMKEIDGLNFVKLDLLSLGNIEIINKTCKLAGIKRVTPNSLDVTDIQVWDSIKESNLGIFQYESDYAHSYYKQLFSESTILKIKEKNPNLNYLDLFSIGNGAIRPAGESYREALANGEYRDNGHKALNDFLAPTLGFLVYQEQIIEFLHSFCGYTMGQADVIRRIFAKFLAC